MFRRAASLISRRTVAARSVNWDYLSSTIGDKVDIAGMRANVEEMEETVMKAPKKITPIDYKAWEAKVGKGPVDAVKKEYERWVKEEKAGLTVTFDEAQKKVIQEDCQTMVNECQTFEDWHRLRLRELEIEIAKITYEKDNIDSLTADDMMKRYPHIAERVDAQIEEGVWPNYKE